MYRRALVLAIVLGMVAMLPVSANTVPRAAPPGGDVAAKFEPGLYARLEAKTTDRYVVEFKAQANLAKAPGIKDFTGRGKFVLDALTTTAKSSQAAAIKLVHGKKGAHATSYWLTNVLLVSGDAALAKEVAALPEVARVRSEHVYPLVDPVKVSAAVLATTGGPQWNIAQIGADKVWAAGDTGSGIVVASIDTGVDYTHPALVNQYRGNEGAAGFNHNYNWWDPTGICGLAPCDNAGHGTHTMGTILGGDGPGPFTPDTGVAPGAQWISAKGCEDMNCSEGALLSAGQFVLAPTDLQGQNADPSKRPQIVSNSWGGPPNDTFYQKTVQAWRAAGIIPVFAAGNAGPSCGSAGSPGDYPETIAVGATDSNDLIAGFSSRGPSTFGKIDPDVSAPGVNVTSSMPGGGYMSEDGTSMATPHVAGTIALMLSARPSLIGDFDGVASALRSTAVNRVDLSCGGAPSGDPNNVYGDGRIDAEAAFLQVKTGGTLVGIVTDKDTAAPIADARVTAADEARSFDTTTDSSGHYKLFLAAGTYTVTAQTFGYADEGVAGVEIVTDQTKAQDIHLTALPRFAVTGHVSGSEDGSPIDGAAVRAIGTPVAPAVTDASGAYSLLLPAGIYSLEARAGGCTEALTSEVDLSGGPATLDFGLFRKLDDAGHGCRAIPVDWVTTGNESALYGDFFTGRLKLPFSFPFYGKSYDHVYISDDGYLSFLAPQTYQKNSTGPGVPIGIPSADQPNAAIYALWQDLSVDDNSSIGFSTAGTAPNRAFVIDYASVVVRGGSDRVSLEVKLWEDGRIDVLYGANSGMAADGSQALIGIENETGTDGLQFGFFESVLGPNVAYRYEHVPTGIVHGVATDRNDGLPLAGATVVATPGGRQTTTAVDGSYQLRLRPGNYSIAVSAAGYVQATSQVTVTDGGDQAFDAELAAPIAAVSPASVKASTAYGTPATASLSLTNTGSAPLSWTILERDQGATLPALPTLQKTHREATWAPARLPAVRPLAKTQAIPPALLQTVVRDPVGDATGSIDIVGVRGGSDTSELSVALDFTAGTPIDQVVGYVLFDTDQNPMTGIPAAALTGIPGQDVGADFYADLFEIHDPVQPVVPIWDTAMNLVALVPVNITGQTISFDVPLSALGGDDDGTADVDTLLGDFMGPTDAAPDAGHGTIAAFRDAPWMDVSPKTGSVDPGTSQTIAIELGSADLGPGEYQALLGVMTSAPKQPSFIVPVDFTVTLPAAFGAVSGTTTDAHTGMPIDATVTVHSQWQQDPLDVVATSQRDGTFQLFGPEGTWPITFSKEGYVSVDRTVTITRGVTLAGQDAALHLVQPHAALSGGPLELVVAPGKTVHRTLTLSNADGHATLTYKVGEVNLTTGPSMSPASGPIALPAGANPNARTTKGLARPAVAAPPSIKATTPAPFLNAWPTGLQVSWGVGYDGNVWIGDPQAGSDNKFTTEGALQSSFATSWVGQWGADMGRDPVHGLLWQVNVGGDNGIYGLDPSDGSVKATITGSPWTNTSQRGLAYDPDSDTFYVGGWNEGIVYHVAGMSWANPGETLGQCTPPDPAISGLAWNPSFRMLWEATNSQTDTIYLLDPTTCEAKSALASPEGGFSGAGMEMDDLGNLWVVSQTTNTAYLIESGLPNFSDVPWLTVAPESGTIATGAGQALDVTVDTTGLTPGLYRAAVVVVTNDPDHPTMAVPVTVVVPAYQQGINAGGGGQTNGNGDVFAADQQYTAGSFGWVGPSSTRKSIDAIAGTSDDPLYQDLREGMTAYRFDLANGHYRVDLSFAELVARKAGARVFSVSIEGRSVLSNFDVFAVGGHDTAVDRSYEVDVTDGHLDIAFTAQRGDQPIVNAIMVTEIPPSASPSVAAPAQAR